MAPPKPGRLLGEVFRALHGHHGLTVPQIARYYSKAYEMPLSRAAMTVQRAVRKALALGFAERLHPNRIVLMPLDGAGGLDGVLDVDGATRDAHPDALRDTAGGLGGDDGDVDMDEVAGVGRRGPQDAARRKRRVHHRRHRRRRSKRRQRATFRRR